MGRLSRGRTSQKIGRTHPLDDFFASYPQFNGYDPSKSSRSNFQRLRKRYGWQRGDKDGDTAWRGFQLALVKEFNARFGVHGRDLLAWQTFGGILGIEGMSEMTEWEECEKVIKALHYDLINVLDAHRHDNGEKAQVFATEEALADYVKRTGIYFPKYHEDAGYFLRRVLRRHTGRQPANLDSTPSDEPPRHWSRKRAQHEKARSTKGWGKQEETGESVNNGGYMAKQTLEGKLDL